MPVFDIKEPLACLRDGKADEAIPMLEHLVQITPGHVTAYVLLAQAYAAEARWRDAMTTWQHAAFLMPNSPAILNGLEQALQMFSLAGISIEAEPSEAKANPDAGTDSSPAFLLASDSEPETDLEPTDSFFAESATESAAAAAESLFEESIEETIEETVEETIEESVDIAGVVEVTTDEPTGDLASELADELAAEWAAMDAPEEDATPAANEMAAPSKNGASHGTVQAAGDEELDRLISDLESARIVPRPDYETIEGPSLTAPIDDMVSETLARIYEGQKQYDEAARMYDKLAILKPDRADVFTQKAIELRTRAHSE